MCPSRHRALRSKRQRLAPVAKDPVVGVGVGTLGTLGTLGTPGPYVGTVACNSSADAASQEGKLRPGVVPDTAFFMNLRGTPEEVLKVQPHLPVPHLTVRERHLRLPRGDHRLQVVPPVDQRRLLARHQDERLDLREVRQLLRIRLTRHDGVGFSPTRRDDPSQPRNRGEVPRNAEGSRDDSHHLRLPRALDQVPPSLHHARHVR